MGQQDSLLSVVANLTATADAVSQLSPALADAIPLSNKKIPDACFCLPFAFAQMSAPVSDDWKEVYHRTVEAEPVAERFSGEQELEQKAQAAAVRRAGVQAVEGCSTGQAATIQTSTASENRDAEGEGRKSEVKEWF